MWEEQPKKPPQKSPRCTINPCYSPCNHNDSRREHTCWEAKLSASGIVIIADDSNSRLRPPVKTSPQNSAVVQQLSKITSKDIRAWWAVLQGAEKQYAEQQSKQLALVKCLTVLMAVQLPQMLLWIPTKTTLSPETALESPYSCTSAATSSPPDQQSLKSAKIRRDRRSARWFFKSQVESIPCLERSRLRAVVSSLRNKTNTDWSSLSDFLLYSGVFDTWKAMGKLQDLVFGKTHPSEPALLYLFYQLGSSPSFSP